MEIEKTNKDFFSQCLDRQSHSKFLFVYPVRSAGGIYGGCQYYLGAAYIISYHGYKPEDVSFVLADSRLTWDETAQLICHGAGRAVGFTVYNSNYAYVKKLAQKIKKIRPELIIACGGPSATFSGKRILQDCDAIDLCVAGEGEQSFGQLFKTGFNPEYWENIPSLVIRKHNKVINTQDQIQSCYSKEKEGQQPISPYLVGIIPPSLAPSIGIFTSKGCQFACTYCSFTAASRRKISFYPEPDVIEEFKLICQWFEKTGHSATIEIMDDNFVASIPRAKRLLKQITEFRPDNLSFAFSARPDGLHDDEFYELAVNAGVVEIGFGLESSDPKVLSLVKKVRVKKGRDYLKEAEYPEKVRAAVGKAASYGINATVSIIIGLPGDTEVSAMKTLEFVKSLPVSSYYHNILNVFDGTELSITHKDYGIERKKVKKTPFPETVHLYDTHNFPILPNASLVRDFLGINLHLFISVLSGLTDFIKNLGIPLSYICFKDYDSSTTYDNLPAGTSVMALNKQEDKSALEQYNLRVNYLEQTSYGKQLKPGFNPGQCTPPSIFLPGDDTDVKQEHPGVFFFKMTPEQDMPESLVNQWKLPYGACGLINRNCPARGMELKSDMNKDNTCIFYPLDKHYTIQDCEHCEKHETCPKCSYLLMHYPDSYCKFHRSGKAEKLLAYLNAHYYALTKPGADITRLPAIAFEDFDLPDKNSSVIRVDDQLSLVKW